MTVMGNLVSLFFVGLLQYETQLGQPSMGYSTGRSDDYRGRRSSRGGRVDTPASWVTSQSTLEECIRQD